MHKKLKFYKFSFFHMHNKHESSVRSHSLSHLSKKTLPCTSLFSTHVCGPTVPVFKVEWQHLYRHGLVAGSFTCLTWICMVDGQVIPTTLLIFYQWKLSLRELQGSIHCPTISVKRQTSNLTIWLLPPCYFLIPTPRITPTELIPMLGLA